MLQEQGKGHLVECRARDSVTLGIASVRRDRASLRVGRAVVAGFWAEKNSIKGSCEQRGPSPTVLLRRSPCASVRRLLFCSGHPWPAP